MPFAAPNPSNAFQAAPRMQRAAARRRLFVALLPAVVLLLAACGGPSVVTVRGTIVDQLQNPIPNADVLVNDVKTSTASDGTFSVPDVQPPYDVAVSVPGGFFVQLFLGLTAASPTLESPGAYSFHQATIAGSLGSAAFQSAEAGLVLPAGSTLALGAAMVSQGSGPTYGPATVKFGGASTRSTTLYGLRALVDSNGNPTSFTGYGTLHVDLHDGDTLTGLTIPMASVTSDLVNGSIVAPSGYSLTDGHFVLRFGDGSNRGIVGLPLANAAPTGTFSGQVVPVATGIGYGLAASASDGANAVMGYGTVPGPGSSATLDLPDAAVPTAPADGATNVSASTVFHWTALPDAVYIARLVPVSGPGPSIDIMTRQTSMSLPDLSALGAAIPANTPYTLTVLAAGPLASIDEGAGTHGVWNIEIAFETAFGGTPQPLSGPTTTGWLTSSKSTTFTTAP